MTWRVVGTQLGLTYQSLEQMRDFCIQGDTLEMSWDPAFAGTTGEAYLRLHRSKP